MYCANCGAKLEEGERFCYLCGTKVEEGQLSGQSQPPTVPAPSAFPQAGQMPYPPAPSVYPQAGGQPPYSPMPPAYDKTGGKPPRKKPGKGLWIGIGAGVLAAILILALLVYPGLLIGSRGPLSGSTVQIRFVNDSVSVFADAFSGLSDTALSEMMQQPFEMSADVDVAYGESSGTINMAYDGLSFGLEAESEGSANTLLLLEDTVYVTSYGSVQGIEFDTATADLSASMGLAERFKALLGSSEESNANVDWKKAAELLVNSINEDCFKKGSSKTTLKMDSGDLTDMLDAFLDKLEADDDLRESLEDFFKDMMGESVDMEDMIDEATALIRAGDSTLEWVVSYENGKPVSMEITIEIAGEKITASFGYEKSGSAMEVTCEINADGEKIKGSFGYERTKEGLEFSLELSADGQVTIIEGTAKRAKDQISGVIEIADSSSTTTVEYEGTLNIGKPEDDVEDMFDIDTKDAYVRKSSALFSSLGYNYSDPIGDSDYDTPEESSESPEPATSDEPAASAASGDSHIFDGTLWYSNDGEVSVYFLDGKAYFGVGGMTKEDYSGIVGSYDVSYTLEGNTLYFGVTGLGVYTYDGVYLWLDDDSYLQLVS